MSSEKPKLEIRWYKGKYKVEVVLRSKGNWPVKALEKIRFRTSVFEPDRVIHIDETFVTVPRLLWRHPRK